ncbi:MAG: PTS sugar transporter subunit IIA [Deltaproteobacteria bacterium]|nr:PTS sugar transporter subunit IIA [Deltaproteobacteria bacterium]
MVLRLIDITDERLIKIGFPEKKRDAVFIELIGLITAAHPFEDSPALFKRFVEREDVMSTAIGSAIAIPHIISGEIEAPLLAIGIDKDGIQYDAASEPVKLIFMFVGPSQKREPYLESLVRVSKLLKVEQNRTMLITASTPSQVLSIIKELD